MTVGEDVTEARPPMKRIGRIVFTLFATLAVLLGDAGSTGLDAAPAACRADDLGVNINNLSFASLASPQLVNALDESGAGWVRINVYWAWTEQSPNQFDWSAMDRGIAVLRANRLEPLVTLLGPVPCWALDQDKRAGCKQSAQELPAADAWAAFVTAVVQRYKGKVRYWEVWNEPNLFESFGLTMEQRLVAYRERLLIPAQRAIRAANPDARIVAPALGVIEGMGERRMISDIGLVFDRGAAADVDAISIHIYAPGDLTAYGLALKKSEPEAGLGQKPLWLTETGALLRPQPGAPADDVGPERYLQGQIASTLARHVYSRLFWFALTDSNKPDGTHADTYGLIDNSDFTNFVWKPRPSYLLFKNLAVRECRSDEHSGQP